MEGIEVFEYTVINIYNVMWTIFNERNVSVCN